MTFLYRSKLSYHLTLCVTFGQQLILVPPLSTTAVPPGRPAHPWHALVAGAVGGYFVWGEWSALSHQVLLYISIRVLAGLGKLVVGDGDAATTVLPWRTQHRVAATIAWAAIMYLWETTPHVVQPSMRKSMDEIYDSKWWQHLVHRESSSSRGSG